MAMTVTKKNRPIRISFLTILFVCLAAWNCLRLGEAIFFWKTISAYHASPLYISISGGIWLIIGLLIAWGLWKGKGWGRVAALWCMAGYTIWYWFDRLALQETHSNWPFVLVINMISLLFVFSILFSHRARLFFARDAYER
jgi:hypothetical protein